MRTIRWTTWTFAIGLCAACGSGPPADSGTTPTSAAAVATTVPNRPAAVTIPVATPRKPDVEAGTDLGDLQAVIADATVAAP